MKKWDCIVIGTCCILAFLPIVLFSIRTSFDGGYVTKFAIIRINGKEVDRINLDNTDYFEKTYHPAKGKYNIVEERNGKIRVKEDNSPDQIAVRTGWISEIGQTSICLPHKLVIEIVAKDGDVDTGYPIY